MEITCKFYDINEKLPEKSGKYLCLGGCNYWASLSYSVKHKAFNVYDSDKYRKSITQLDDLLNYFRRCS